MNKKINIQVMTVSAFENIRNSNDIYNYILNNPDDSSFLKDLIKGRIYDKKEYVIDDFELKYSKNYKEVEFENAVILYEHLKGLPKHILSDNRFWAWIIFEKAYKQAQVATDFSENMVKNNWLAHNSRRSVLLNVMARQFYKVKISIDESIKDKYALTKYLLTNHSIYKNLTMRNIGMISTVSKAVLKASYAISLKNNGYKFKDLECSEFLKIISEIGSTKLIDVIPEEELYLTLCKNEERIMSRIIFNVKR